MLSSPSITFPPASLWRRCAVLITLLAVPFSIQLQAQVTVFYTVTESAGSLFVSGPNVPNTPNPTFSVEPGDALEFTVNTSALYPVVLSNSNSPLVYSLVWGALPQNSISTGQIWWTVPTVSYPSTVYLLETIHGVYATINVTAPPSIPEPATTGLIAALACAGVIVICRRRKAAGA